ncbi:MAG: hypothetical protein GX249_12700 [Firmicutes bacterium]|nr:hypothetical protein [Bacillota bacterium]
MLEEKRPLVGWSDVPSSPEVAEVIKKMKRSSLRWTWVFTLLFPVGFVIAGLVSDEVPLNEVVMIGGGLGLLMLVINLWRISGTKKPAWDGVVIKKLEKKRWKNDKDGTSQSYTEYIVVIRTEAGKKKRIVERQGDMYDYLDVGDRVRYHPALESYEKFDKSKDTYIYCNICRLRNSIRNDRCERCNHLLFK